MLYGAPGRGEGDAVGEVLLYSSISSMLMKKYWSRRPRPKGTASTGAVRGEGESASGQGAASSTGDGEGNRVMVDLFMRLYDPTHEVRD